MSEPAPVESSRETRISRTVTEHTTSYWTRIPDDVFTSPLAGHLRYTLQIHDNRPCIAITELDADAEFGENDRLVFGGTEVPLPRSLIETCRPVTITDWTSDETSVYGTLDLPAIEHDAAARGEPSIRQRGSQHVLPLPITDALDGATDAAVRFAYDGGRNQFVLHVTPVDSHADATPILDATAMPQIPLPATLVEALGGADTTIPVVVTTPDPTTSPLRSQILTQYPAVGGTTNGESIQPHSSADTANGDAEATTAHLAMPIPEASRGQSPLGAGRSLDVALVADEGTPLLILARPGTIDATPISTATITEDEQHVLIESRIGKLLGVQESTIHWHRHDGNVILEIVGMRDAVPPTLHGSAGHLQDTAPLTVTIPERAMQAADFQAIPPYLDCRLLTTDDGFAVQATPTTDGRDRPTVYEVLHTDAGPAVSIDEPLATLLTGSTIAGLVWVARDGRVIGVPVDEPTFARATADDGPHRPSPADAFADMQLYLPEDGRNRQVREVGEGDPAIGLPTEAQDQLSLESGSKFAITIGEYDGYLALRCTPIEEADADVCLGRMLSQSNMRLPIQLVATLSLYERELTWAIEWAVDGPRLIGFVEPMPSPPLDAGHSIGMGTVTPTTRRAEQPTHYTATIPRAAFEVFGATPPGVFVSYEYIDGDGRLLVFPVGEEDLAFPGAVKLQQGDRQDEYRFTVPKSLAAAMNLSDDERLSWVELDGQFIGTLSASQAL